MVGRTDASHPLLGARRQPNALERHFPTNSTITHYRDGQLRERMKLRKESKSLQSQLASVTKDRDALLEVIEHRAPEPWRLAKAIRARISSERTSDTGEDGK